MDRMIQSYEDFEVIVINWLLDIFGETASDEQLEPLWESLGLQDYVDRLYMLCRRDAHIVAKAEIGVDLDTLCLPPDFWDNVQKGVESGLGCWSEVMQTAVEEALREAKPL